MLSSLLLSSVVLISQLPSTESDFVQLQTQLESYGFKVNVAIPPNFNPPRRLTRFRRSTRKPYGVLHAASKSIWINPIVFELGIGRATLIHEAVHAAQYCVGQGKIKAIGLELEPIPQALPYFKRYVDTQRQDLEREAYTIQTQPNSFELAVNLLEQHCKIYEK